MILSETEKRVLKSFQLRGIMGNCGAMNKKQRLNLLNSLIDRKLLNKNCTLTNLGIQLTSNSNNFKITNKTNDF